MDDSILLVEDNPDNRDLTQMLLEAEGFQVRVAEDAAQALAVLATWRPSLILMDVQLPGMDGLELTRRIRADAPLRDVTIVALSAYAMAAEKANAMAAGCDGYITKPIDTRSFADTVRRYLGHRSPRPPASKQSLPDSTRRPAQPARYPSFEG